MGGQESAPITYIVCQGTRRASHQRGQTLLGALTAHQDKPVIDMDIAHIEPNQLTHAQATTVKHFQDGMIAQVPSRLRESLDRAAPRHPPLKGIPAGDLPFWAGATPPLDFGPQPHRAPKRHAGPSRPQAHAPPRHRNSPHRDGRRQSPPRPDGSTSSKDTIPARSR